MSSTLPPLRPTDRQIVTTLGQHGRLSRDRLAALSGLPRSTVADALARLRRRGIVLEQAAPETAGRTGRPPRLLELAAPAGLVGVIVLTHQTLQAAVTGFDGTLLSLRTADPYVHDWSTGSAGPGTAMLVDALREISSVPADLACAVIGVPVPVAETGQLVGDTELQETSFSARLAAEFSRQLGLSVWVENDANLGALGEGAFGAATDMTNFIYIKLVHGIGAGLVLNRSLYRGTNGLAGELAHVNAEADGSLCRCGGRGCLITKFNTPRLIDWIQAVHPSVGTMSDILALGASKDAGVWRILRDLGRTVGRSLADFCVYMAPDGIVLDGILESAAAPVIDGITEMLGQFTPPATVAQMRITAGQLGQHAELRGAAVLARRRQSGDALERPSPASSPLPQDVPGPQAPCLPVPSA
jgi:predicted NBD/HSP70 family sugar kinase